MKFVILCLFVVLARGQDDFPCCIPDERWEIFEGFMVGTSTAGVASETEGGAMISFDGTKQMVNSYIESTTSGKVTKLRVLQDYKQRVQYMIENQKCTKSPITTEYQPPCVPAGSTKISSSYYGTQEHPFIIDVYKINVKGFSGYASVAPLGPKLCIGVGQSLYGNVGSTSEISDIGYTNYTKGIKDPSVFVVPPECKQVPLIQFPINGRRLRRSVLY